MRALTVAIPATSFPSARAASASWKAGMCQACRWGGWSSSPRTVQEWTAGSQVVTARRNGLRALGVGESRRLFELRLCGLRLYEEHERLG